MYCASSSLRAWTLRLPSVVWSSFFSSLKVRLSLTASALRMPRRSRSWMSRSSCGAPPATGTGAAFFSRSFFKAEDCLATVFHRNYGSEQNVQAAESSGQQAVAPRGRSQQRRRTYRHEADSHHGHDAHRSRAARHHTGAVKEHPGARNRGGETRAVESRRQDRSGQHRRHQPAHEFAAGSGQQRHLDGMRFALCEDHPDGQSNHRRHEPDLHPGTRARHVPGHQRRPQRDGPHQHAADARHSRERSGAFHGLADISKVIDGVVLHRNRFGADGTNYSHEGIIAQGCPARQVLYEVKKYRYFFFLAGFEGSVVASLASFDSLLSPNEITDSPA